MDYSNLPLERYPMVDKAFGFGSILAMDELALKGSLGMSESQKEQIIMKCRDAKSEYEVESIVKAAVPNGGASALYEGPHTS